MLLEQITEYLESYRVNTGRLAFLRTQTEELENAIQRRMSSLVSDQVLCPPKTEDGGHGNLPSSQVENLAVRIADGWVSADIRDMQRDLKAIRQELRATSHRIACVDGWLQGLTEQEQWVVRHQIINGESWRDVSMGFREHFQTEDCGKNRLKYIKERAMNQILRMTEV